MARPHKRRTSIRPPGAVRSQGTVRPAEASPVVFSVEPPERWTFDTSFFGKKIRRLRKLRGWTIDRLAQETDMEPTQIMGYESGRRNNPELKTVLRFARAFQVRPRSLVDPEEPVQFERPAEILEVERLLTRTPPRRRKKILRVVRDAVRWDL